MSIKRGIDDKDIEVCLSLTLKMGKKEFIKFWLLIIMFRNKKRGCL